jgi:hypothetical protein
MHMKKYPTASRAAAIFCALLFAASAGYAQTVVSRSKVGGYAEDVTFVSSGPLKGRLVMLNGYELYTVDVAKKEKDKAPLSRLCEVKIPEFDQFPNGFAYVESEGLFFMNQSTDPTKLYLFDRACAFKGTRPIQYLNGAYRPGHMEGMAHIPPNSPAFPDHLVMAVWDDLAGGAARLEVVRRDGVVVSEIFRADWPEDLTGGGLGDVVFLAPDRLLVSTFTNSFWTMDFSGHILSGPLTFPPETFSVGEGLIQVGDGRFVATSFPQSLIFFDKNLNRLPESDRHDVLGLNLNIPGGVAWDSDTNRLLISHDNPSSNTTPGIDSVPTTLDGATPFVNLSGFQPARQLAYLPDEHLTAIVRQNPQNARAILLFNSDGTLNSQISLSPASLGQNLGQPLTIAYIPASHEFVVGFNGGPFDPAAERRRLRVFSRAGALVRTIDLTSTGTGGVAGFDYFDDPDGGGGRFLILGSAGRAFVTDLNGNSRNSQGFLFREFNTRVKFGLITRGDVTAITTGPLAGAFAVVDGSGGEVVIFRLN